MQFVAPTLFHNRQLIRLGCEREATDAYLQSGGRRACEIPAMGLGRANWGARRVLARSIASSDDGEGGHLWVYAYRYNIAAECGLDPDGPTDPCRLERHLVG